MKQFYFLILLTFGFAFLGTAQNSVTVNASATQNGYANIFETPANGGGFVFGQPWGVPDLKTVVDAGANSLTLQPNFNNYGDGTDAFWVDQTTGLGNKTFEGNTYVEDNTLVGSQLTFEGSVSSFTINPDYQVLAFIKVFNADYSFLKQENFEITTTGNFSVSYTNVEASDAVVQYGFQVTGLNANPANEAALGSVVVGEIPSVTVTVNASATQNGYANIFETPANGGGFVFGQPWGVPDLKTVVDAGANSLTLQPNFNNYGDGTDAFWVDQTTGLGNKTFEGNTYVEDNTLVGSQLTFEGSVSSFTINPDYQVLAFIKVFNADYSFLKQENFEITTTGNFSVSYTNVEASDAVVQYGFQVTGLNANPANEASLGSVVVGEPVAPDLVELPVTFESVTANYNVIGFGGVDPAVETNPDQTGINTSNTVVRSTKTVGAEFWGGVEMSLDVPIDFSASEVISIKTWSPKADIPVRLKLEDGLGGFVELDVNTTVTNEWETLTWDFSGQTVGMDFNKVVIFFEFVPGLGGDGSSYYYDDIEVVVFPTPSLPITLEEDVNPYFQDFNGSDTQIITNPYQEGGNTSAEVAQNIVPANTSFAGVSFSVQTIDISQGKTFNLDVRTILPDASILLKLENTVNGSSIEREIVVAEENQWENITFDFGTEADATYDKVTLFMYFNSSATVTRVAYWDNLEQNLNDLVELPVTFESATADYNVVGFGGVEPAVESNPDPSGENTSNTVVRSTKTVGAEFWGGAEMTLDVAIDFSESESISIKTWSPKADIPVRLKLEDGLGGFVELDVNTTVANQWEILTWNFTGQTAGLNFNKVVLFFEFVPGLSGDGSIYYYDDIEIAPIVPDLVELPVTFESATANYNVIGFEGADSAVEANPDPSGENTSNTVVRSTKTEGAQFFAGTAMTLDVAIDFSESESISIKTWSPKADIPVRLKLEAADPAVFVELDVNTTVANQWETLTWDFTGQTAGIDFVNVVVFFEFVVDLPGDGSTYYYDDIEVATPAEELLELPVDFESTTIDYDLIGFEGAESTVVANPDASGENTSNTVVETIKTEGAQFFAGTAMTLDVAIDFSESESISIKTWSPKADIPVRLKLEAADPAVFVELDVNTTVANQWETLTWDFTGQTAGIDFVNVVVFFEFVVDLPGDGSTYYYDDIEVATPAEELLELPVDFESTTIDYDLIGFEGAESTVVANPDASGENTSNTVVETIKTEGAQFFAGTAMTLDVAIDFSESESISIKTWSPKADIPVRLKLEAADPAVFVELDVNTTVANQWETLTWDFTGQTAGIDFVNVVVFFEFVVDLPGDGSTYYYDDIEVATPAEELLELPVDFESTTIDYDLIGFEGAESTVVANPDASGENTSNTVVETIKTEGAQFFAGTAMTLDVAIDFSESESISIKTWSPKADIPVRLKLEAADPAVFVELDVNTTVANQWETLTWDFTGQTAGIDFVNVVVFFEFVVDLPGDGSTYYYDDIEVATPAEELLELPVDFESTTIDYDLIGFEGAESTVVANPDASGENTSNTVVETIKTEGAQFFAGTAMTLDVAIDFSESESISIKTWSPKADIPVRLKLEAADPAVFVELDVNTTVANQWETLTWDFTGQTAGIDFVNVVVFFEFVVDLPGDGSTYYYDDIEVADAPLSINDNFMSTVVSYPNPVKTYWNVKAEQTITDIVIYNLFGQRILSITPNMSDVSLNMSEFKSGIYLVHVISDEGTKIMKVLKQ